MRVGMKAGLLIERLLQILSALVVLTSPLVNAAGLPSFLVIVADDMGWSDVGVLGSEIRTPTLDALAAKGMLMPNFYTAPTCSPTRAMLMTGVDSHLAGLGTMDGVQTPNQIGSRNYAGQLHDGVATVAEVLQTAGYSTLISGKWHLATDGSQYPSERGFERSFVLLEGGASHFGDGMPLYRGVGATYLENGLPVSLPKDFYSSIAFADKLMAYLAEIPAEQPFFAYLAFTAPHDPLQVPEAWLDKYEGIYLGGPRVLREQRVRKLKEQGRIPLDADIWQVPQMPAFLPAYIEPWDQLTDMERRAASRPMEIYAAMIELMDQQIRRVLNQLADAGRLQDTYVIFLSDNGANGATPLSYPNNTREWFLEQFSQRMEDQGRVGSHTYLGREWASATAAPFKLYKGAVAEGGIRVPFIVSGPGVAPNSQSQQVGHVTDLPVTLYELARIDVEQFAAFEDIAKPSGRSLWASWQSPDWLEPRTFATELFGHSAVVSDHWKAVNLRPPLGSGSWQLFNLRKDPSELHDRSVEFPEKLGELVGYYQDYEQRVGVIPPEPPIAVSMGDLFTGECDWWCEAKVSLVDALMNLIQKLMVWFSDLMNESAADRISTDQVAYRQ